ncbi:hypothetical protein GXM_01289 [Nostoc sphaeroides CCNUC1]|uniref:Uncharacterized protein n=1 Tax=Nostoc sphaeroides CCNUC1 TaxID=2653204 RepID=A0A5P8VUJ6_9NOSO|nr:hypothetical protein GXM_01289 [Nostoc sphaeroides CCNUC1]
MVVTRESVNKSSIKGLPSKKIFHCYCSLLTVDGSLSVNSQQSTVNSQQSTVNDLNVE